MPGPSLELLLSDSQATELLGAALARACRHDGGGSGVVYLHGELGAGKTTCVRSLLRTLGVPGLVRSPTYTLVETYELGDLTCVHVDLYRLQGPVAVEELGLRDSLDECLLLVEWPEKGEGVLPPPDLELWLTYVGESRGVRLTALGERGGRWAAHLLRDTSLAPYVSNLT